MRVITQTESYVFSERIQKIDRNIYHVASKLHHSHVDRINKASTYIHNINYML